MWESGGGKGTESCGWVGMRDCESCVCGRVGVGRELRVVGGWG